MSTGGSSWSCLYRGFNILQDRGVPIFKAIAKQLGVDVGAVKMMASKGN
jgi:tape measure domain-containing protein